MHLLLYVCVSVGVSVCGVLLAGLIFSHATPVLWRVLLPAHCISNFIFRFQPEIIIATWRGIPSVLALSLLLLLLLHQPPATASISEFLLVALAAPENSVTCVTQGSHSPNSYPHAARYPFSWPFWSFSHFGEIFAHFFSSEHGQNLHGI